MGPTSTGVAWRCYSKPTERSEGKKILRVLAALENTSEVFEPFEEDLG